MYHGPFLKYMQKIFQTDSKIVKDAYLKLPNYEIFYNNKISKKSVAIYFSSNGIYFPNIESEFEEKIINQNRFEWKKNKISNCQKHIFLRDINKQWYLNGINHNLDNIEKIVNFLKKETTGYDFITTLGVSSGGFAAILFGIKINANKIFSFNGQFDLEYMLKDKNCEVINPILYRFQNNPGYRKYYNIENLIKDFSGEIFYFSSLKSERDKNQIAIAKKYNNIIKIFFTNNIHSLPFYPFLLNHIFMTNSQELKKLERKEWNKFNFSITTIGSVKTIIKLTKYYFKNYKNKLWPFK